MSPQLRKAAEYVIDNANDVGLSSIREIAEAAAVKPNTLVRMARAVGFEGYEDFRRPFREELQGRAGGLSRPCALAAVDRQGRAPRPALLRNRGLFHCQHRGPLCRNFGRGELKAAADRIVAAHSTYVLGVGIAYALAHNFAYLARMAFDRVVAVPQERQPADRRYRQGGVATMCWWP